MKVYVSIIIPIYNVARYLGDCIDSILKQSFTDFELILVDDGSIDGCGQLCDEFERKDKRIKVIHKQNGGVSSARNAGLDIACGEWITFIDADDFISIDFIKNLFDITQTTENLDFIHGGCSNWMNGKVVGINQQYELKVSNNPCELFNNVRGLTVSKLFRRRLIEILRLRFDEKIKIAEDLVFTLDYIDKVSKYAFVPECGYFYRMDNPVSVTKSIKCLNYNDELHRFQHMYESVIHFKSSRNLTDNQALIRLRQCASALETAIRALYWSGLTRGERIQILANGIISNYYNLLAYLDKSSIKGVSLLLEHKYSIFDSIQYLHNICQRIRRMKS